MPAPLAYQTAVVSGGDGNRVRLAYIDSWAARPRNEHPSAYVTIIAVHGFGFNSAVWVPMFAHLPSDVRCLAYNQRGYAGSEAAFPAQKESGTDAMATYVADLAGVVEFAAGELEVPAVGGDGAGGIVLLAWSKGTNLPIGLLAATLAVPPSPTNFLSALPSASNSLAAHPSLATHLRSIILFEPATVTLGLPSAPSFLAALAHPPDGASSQPSTRPIATSLGDYICSYDPLGDTSLLPPSSLPIAQATIGCEAWQPQCLAIAGWDPAASAEEKGALARRALREAVWPVGLLWGGATVEQFGSVVGEFEKMWARATEEGQGGKRAVRCVQGMNHVGQVLIPKEFVAALTGLVEELGCGR